MVLLLGYYSNNVENVDFHHRLTQLLSSALSVREVWGSRDRSYRTQCRQRLAIAAMFFGDMSPKR